AGRMDAGRGADLRDAFEFISYVRFRHQAARVRAGQAPDNRLSPDELSSFDKRHLREAFAIVRSAQSTLGVAYGTGKLG
ncbi:MAG TPA: putative nucleotidyltransferase substrate binding domain-containing protein, partial [Tetrasphaera sp.]